MDDSLRASNTNTDDQVQNPHLTIGACARRSMLSPKALRLCDRQGLLSPAEVDPTNGYRRCGKVSWPMPA